MDAAKKRKAPMDAPSAAEKDKAPDAPMDAPTMTKAPDAAMDAPSAAKAPDAAPSRKAPTIKCPSTCFKAPGRDRSGDDSATKRAAVTTGKALEAPAKDSSSKAVDARGKSLRIPGKEVHGTTIKSAATRAIPPKAPASPRYAEKGGAGYDYQVHCCKTTQGSSES
ncbi:hypothetical protein SELMODRAFT_432285 [Selaginella moellendorffii]|uniref:Uncharacterized protein n=1 Tax=Selaginella moellendorffii TaxID=88036 RepID=D8TFJ2_SELML|nr:hypothetical protein SELMODRAFT_432285 [Selaginella moellendorffii]